MTASDRQADRFGRLHRIVYLSRCTVGIDQALVQNLMQVSQARNREAGITGLLLIGDGHFLQVIEGHHIAVKHLYAIIQQDRRHTNCTMLLDAPMPARLFAEWHMGVINLESSGTVSIEEFEAISRFHGLLGNALNSASAAVGIAKLFREAAQRERRPAA